jgi:hypothetical protein
MKMEAREGSAYGVVDVGTDHETVATAISTVVDGNDVAGLFIVRRERSNGRNERMNGWMDRELFFVRFRWLAIGVIGAWK